MFIDGLVSVKEELEPDTEADLLDPLRELAISQQTSSNEPSASSPLAKDSQPSANENTPKTKLTNGRHPLRRSPALPENSKDLDRIEDPINQLRIARKSLKTRRNSLPLGGNYTHPVTRRTQSLKCLKCGRGAEVIEVSTQTPQNEIGRSLFSVQPIDMDIHIAWQSVCSHKACSQSH